MVIPEGFPGQRLVVVPRPSLQRALASPGTSHLVVTDCGYYPEARQHGMRREEGIGQAIIMVCARGRGVCEVRGVPHSVEAGQVVIIPPGYSHSYSADPNDPWTIWWAHVAGPDLRELLRTHWITASEPVREVEDVFRVLALIEEAVRTLSRDTTVSSQLAASGAAWHLLTLLSATSHAPGSRSPAIDRARDYLRDHLAERVSVSDLAALVNLSPSHFAALFRHAYGVPVVRYQTDLRMARARELLDTTTIAIAEIAHSVGYPDAFYFSRQFSTVHGLSPRSYRAQHKG